MKTKLITIALALIAVVAAFTIAYATADNEPAGATTIPSESTYLLPPAYVAPITTSTTAIEPVKSVPTPKMAKQTTTTAKPITTTSEVPPPLTPEQEAKIGKFTAEEQFCFDIGQTYPCNTPETEGMSEENLDGTDYGY